MWNNNMTAQRTALLWLILCAGLTGPRLLPAQESWSGFFGWNKSALTMGAYEAIGFTSETRFKSEWSPADNVRFHTEATLRGQWGSSNAFAVLAEERLSPLDQELFPFKDFHSSFDVTQAWASFSYGRVDLVVGQQPLAWGTGYLFNPTSVMYPPSYPGEDLEEVPSTMAITLSFALPYGTALSGYLAFEDRLRTSSSLMDEGKPGRLPFGVKFQARTNSMDLSLSFFREIPAYEEGNGIDRIGMDAAGFLGPIGWYTESALTLQESASGWYDLEALVMRDHISFCVGGDYLIPGVEVTLRGEFAHLGNGESAKGNYAWEELLQGRRALLGEDYLFASAERTFLDDWTASAGSLVNLNEGGAALLGELLWSPSPGVELALFGTTFIGPDGGEMDGKIETAPEIIADITRPAAGISLTVYF